MVFLEILPSANMADVTRARDRPITYADFLPIMLYCSAQIFDPLCSILYSCRNCSIRAYSLVSQNI